MTTAILDIARIEESPITEERIREAVVPAFARESGAEPGFTETELAALRRDDAMASGMISVILGIAFSVLLCLAIGVGIWTSWVIE